MTPSAPTLPDDFSSEARSFITTVARWARIAQPVQASDPLVETQYFSGPNGDIVLLINWRDRPIENLLLRFADKPEIQSVRSLRRAGHFSGHLHEQEKGALEIRRNNGAPVVQLDLAISDYLLVDCLQIETVTKGFDIGGF
jgi:hypothetical protein